MRVDTLLHRLRFARSRGVAQGWIAQGHIRLNGERLVRQDRRVAIGDVLTLPLRAEVAVIEIRELPERRGPPAEARACYRSLDVARPQGIAGGTRATSDPQATGMIGHSGMSEIPEWPMKEVPEQ